MPSELFLEVVHSPGLAHLSYMIGQGGRAAVIDARRDVEPYLQIPADRPVATFCGSGQRASIAASLLKEAGIEEVYNNLGSMAACQAVGCPVTTS